MHCNICGGVEFGPMGERPNARCIHCHSVERTRLLWMYLSRHNITPEMRILHLAPEPGLYTAISARLNEGNYHTGDIEPGRYSFAKGIQRIDLCDLDHLPDDHYDFIVHLHVLEHIPCNIAYTLFHLHRSLKPTGRHVCVIPFLAGYYDECFAEIGAVERNRRFGQDDHVRRFGRDDVDKHLGSVLSFSKDFDASRDFSAAELLSANIPHACWSGLTPNTVLSLSKYDMRLLRAP